MALTDAQKAAVRWFMGYSVQGDSTYAPGAERAYSNVSEMSLRLDTRLGSLVTAEEAKITGFFLPHLAAREGEIQAAASSIDTAQAAVWTRNAREVDDRRRLFADLRRDLCAYLGFPPGSALMPSNRLIRA